MENRSNARDWETRIRLSAAGILGFYQLLSMVYFASGLLSAQAMAAVAAFEAPFYWVFPLMGVALYAHIGTHALLRMRPWYPRVRWPLFAAFTVLPLAAAAGYLQSGALAAQLTPVTLSDEQLSFYRLADLLCTGAILALYGVLFFFRELRLVRRDSQLTAEVTYSTGNVSLVAPATTLLEASRIADVPHPSICGGRARIGAAPEIRLACQAECRGGPVAVTILLPTHIQP